MASYRKQSNLLMTVDPVHVGTGGYRLGRVDLSIVREPGTRLPKIPGTSLSGAARSYAAMQYGSPDCAGQKNHCGSAENCPICYTFGSLNEKAGDTQAYAGAVSIFDARILLFPVHTMYGPVWVSTPQTLHDGGCKAYDLPADVDWAGNQALLTWDAQRVNLGWLMLDVVGKVSVEFPEEWRDESWVQAIRERIALVGESLFSQIVNSNLEVRTSVSIDPARGAAEDGALFSYEALPRATFLVSDWVLDDYRDGSPKRPFEVTVTKQAQALPGAPWKDPLDVVRQGLRLAEWLGVGGMGTRGFGRLALVGKPLDDSWQRKEA